VADVVTLGEAMVTLTPVQRGPLRYASQFMRGMGGAEANFAIGAARLGASARYLSRLGDDEFGRYVLHELRGDGVDVSRVALVDGCPTGMNVKEVREGGDGRTFYYRTGSAASTMGPEALSHVDFTGARWLHISGVFAAVNETTRATVYRAVELAREAGLTVGMDPNIRLKLWDAATARRVLLDLASRADCFFPGVEEGQILFGTDDPDTIAREAFGLGVQTVVVKLGAEGAIGYTAAGERVHVPGFAIRVVDTVGAGDGWAAGFTVGTLRGLGLAEAIRLGNAVGALVCSVSGDVEGLPAWDEVQAFLGKAPRPLER
jgi:2-dehydro-3-deoxygluconokinase